MGMGRKESGGVGWEGSGGVEKGREGSGGY